LTHEIETTAHRTRPMIRKAFKLNFILCETT
jgi:hypothetical protein